MRNADLWSMMCIYGICPYQIIIRPDLRETNARIGLTFKCPLRTHSVTSNWT